MRRLEPDGDAARAGEFPEPVRDLLGHPLLHGEAARVEPHEAGELGDAEDLVAGDIADVGAPVEGQRVMLAQRVEADGALDDLRVAPLDALRALGREDRAQLRVAVVAGGRVEERLHEPARRVSSTGCVEVEAERREDLGGVALEPSPVRRGQVANTLGIVRRKLEDVAARDFLLSTGRAARQERERGDGGLRQCDPGEGEWMSDGDQEPERS